MYLMRSRRLLWPNRCNPEWAGDEVPDSTGEPELRPAIAKQFSATDEAKAREHVEAMGDSGDAASPYHRQISKPGWEASGQR